MAQVADDGLLRSRRPSMRTALVLIDLINDLIHPDGAMPTCAAEVERRAVLASAILALEGPAPGAGLCSW